MSITRVILAVRRDFVQFAMIGLDGVEIAPQRDHAVPCAVGFKIAGDRIGGVGHRMSPQKSPEIGNSGRSVIRVYADDRVGNAGHAVRASSARVNGVQGVSNERDVSNPTGEAGDHVGWQVVDECRNVAIGIDP